MNDIDFTYDEWVSIRSDMSHRMHSMDPITWYRAWSARFDLIHMNPESYPLGYAAMLESWNLRINDSALGSQFASKLLAVNGTNNIFTKDIPFFYTHTPVEFIYRYVPSEKGYEHAYTLAFPNGDFPSDAIKHYFTNSNKNALLGRDVDVTTRMISSVQESTSADAIRAVCEYLGHSKQYIVSTIPHVLKKLMIEDVKSALLAVRMDMQFTNPSDSLKKDWREIIRSSLFEQNAETYRSWKYQFFESALHLTHLHFNVLKMFSPEDDRCFSKNKTVHNYMSVFPEDWVAEIIPHLLVFQLMLDHDVFDGVDPFNALEQIGSAWLKTRLQHEGSCNPSLSLDGVF